MTNQQCIDWLDEQLADIRAIEEECEFGEQDEKQIIRSIRARLIAANKVANAARHWSVCDYPDEIDFRCKDCVKANQSIANWEKLP